MKRALLITGLLLLLSLEILRVYFIMPFPGSQYNNTINIAYWLDRNILWLRLLGLLLIVYPVIWTFKNSRTWQKLTLFLVLAVYGFIFYMFNFKFEADKMFYQPKNKSFATGSTNTVDTSKLILGVNINGEAKAYPIQIIGYHHQVRDTVGGTPVMVTYCTVCRTGRVYSPLVNGKPETFRLVGMDHFNAMFEDSTTGSWWQQATGEAVTGKLKGNLLEELPSQQVTLASWLTLYPNSTVLQPDTFFNKKYEDLAEYDKGTLKSSLEKRDSASWQFKSWVIGVVHRNTAKAYNWNDLVERRLLEDSLPGLPLLITLEKDSSSFHVFSRMINTKSLHFTMDSTTGNLKDINTSSTWTPYGLCVYGQLKGQQLKHVQASQEFWHSWQTFHPKTLKL